MEELRRNKCWQVGIEGSSVGIADRDCNWSYVGEDIGDRLSGSEHRGLE
jgi:hypothetical protein